ncbi:MAG: hypothetical protein IID44_27560 [Planctomycetes bacterium]|nr:hypothetical protein [Planctomycetota bacterium]
MTGLNEQHLLQKMRNQVDDRHRAATRAIRILEEYLCSQQPASSGTRDSVDLGTLNDLLRHMRGDASMRKRVLASISDGWMTVAEISKETHLSEKQIRGVLYSRDVKAKVRVSGNSRLRKFKAQPSGEPSQRSDTSASTARSNGVEHRILSDST